MEGTKVGVGEGGGNEGHFKVIVGYGGDGEGGAVDGDAAFFYHIFRELRWQVETERVPMLADFPVNERGGGIDVALDDMAAEAGCNAFVAGSAIFTNDDPAAAVTNLRTLATL